MTSHSIQPADTRNVGRAGETLSTWQRIGLHLSKKPYADQRLIAYAIDENGRVISCWFRPHVAEVQQ